MAENLEHLVGRTVRKNFLVQDRAQAAAVHWARAEPAVAAERPRVQGTVLRRVSQRWTQHHWNQRNTTGILAADGRM